MKDSLETIRNHKNYENLTIRLSAEDLGILVNWIYDYTTKLAQDNFVELKSEELRTVQSSDNAIIYLQKYLEVQKRIFEEGA